MPKYTPLTTLLGCLKDVIELSIGEVLTLLLQTESNIVRHMISICGDLHCAKKLHN